VASPFHHDLRRDAGGQGKADEGAASGMSADEFVFGLCALLSLSSPICYAGDGRIEFAEFAEILQVVVHLLVGDYRQGLVPGDGLVLVFVQDPFGDVVQVNRKAVCGLDGGDVDAVVIDVAAPQV